MTITPMTKVAEIAAEHPWTMRIFERFGIDYCCGGGRSVEEACAEIGVPILELLGSLQPPQPRERIDWSDKPLRELIAHLIEIHHAFAREELTRLDRLTERVLRAHGAVHPELVLVRNVFMKMRDHLFPHMLREEHILFPWIVALESSVEGKGPRPFSPVSRCESPVQWMQEDHDEVRGVFGELRCVTSSYEVPEDACMDYRAMLASLADLDADLHEHVHLENHVLFPRVVELEAAAP